MTPRNKRAPKKKTIAQLQTSARVDLLLVAERLKKLCGARIKNLTGEQLLHGMVASQMIRDLALNQPNIIFYEFPALEKFIVEVIEEISK